MNVFFGVLSNFILSSIIILINLDGQDSDIYEFVLFYIKTPTFKIYVESSGSISISTSKRGMALKSIKSATNWVIL